MSDSKSKRGGARPGAGRPKKTDLAAYEASYRFNPQRMWVYSPTLDAKKELTSGSRQELIKKAQWLYNNSGLAGGAVDKIARLVIPILEAEAVAPRLLEVEWGVLESYGTHDVNILACGAEVQALGIDYKLLIETILPIIIAILEAIVRK